jgi:hypothetical protein
MQVFIPNEVAKHATNKYLGVLVAAKYARASMNFRAIARRRARRS